MPIASLTKAFTAAAISELVVDGKMDWVTTPVSEYLSELEFRDPVVTFQLTPVDFLSHRTGLPRVEYFGWFWRTESRRDLIKRLKYANVVSKLQSDTDYHNGNFAIAGETAVN
ncbi:hypothetical protein BGX28_003662 [Mortierella sp. GBA30]|nr:hypothetical protein BGX28_003662 [Mortierella sp. GBA30]